jgi:hypothetical protein
LSVLAQPKAVRAGSSKNVSGDEPPLSGAATRDGFGSSPAPLRLSCADTGATTTAVASTQVVQHETLISIPFLFSCLR